VHTKYDLIVHLVWIPRYCKKILTGPLAVSVRDLIRQVAMEHDLQILPGKVTRDHIHVFISNLPHQAISKIVQWLKVSSSRVLITRISPPSKTIVG
jgi:putative transposase